MRGIPFGNSNITPSNSVKVSYNIFNWLLFNKLLKKIINEKGNYAKLDTGGKTFIIWFGIYWYFCCSFNCFVFYWT